MKLSCIIIISIIIIIITIIIIIIYLLLFFLLTPQPAVRTPHPDPAFSEQPMNQADRLTDRLTGRQTDRLYNYCNRTGFLESCAQASKTLTANKISNTMKDKR